MGTGLRIFWAIVLIALCVGGYVYYDHYRTQKRIEDGAYTCDGCMTLEEKARFDKENSGETADGQSERKTRTARAEDAAGNPQGAAAAAGQLPATQPTSAQPTSTQPSAASPVPTQTAPAASPSLASRLFSSSPSSPPAPAAPAPVSTAAGALPVTDSVAPNPTNGMHFGGSGSYQWYRQGNLTWRVDTVSGGSCIAFATLEEWRKQIVYSHGCGRGA